MTVFNWIESCPFSPKYFTTTSLLYQKQDVFASGCIARNYIVTISYGLVPKSVCVVSGQSECHSFSQHNSNPLCVSVMKKKGKEKKKPLLFLWGLTWWWHAVLLWELPDRRDRLFARDGWGGMKSMRVYDGRTCQTPAIETDMMTDIDTGGKKKP